MPIHNNLILGKLISINIVLKLKMLPANLIITSFPNFNFPFILTVILAQISITLKVGIILAIVFLTDNYFTFFIKERPKFLLTVYAHWVSEITGAFI
jgi:general stress protein CsbA